VDDALVALRLAGDAGSNPGKSFSPLLGYGFTAIVAFLGALALGCQCPGAKEGILNRIVDLVLNRAVSCPSAGHVFLSLKSNAPPSLQDFVGGAI
jgi:hypothetical protein